MDALIADAGEGAGDDQADAGTKTFEREHEMSLVINARDMVLQTERALERIDTKTYGNCEECGSPLVKHVFKFSHAQHSACSASRKRNGANNAPVALASISSPGLCG